VIECHTGEFESAALKHRQKPFDSCFVRCHNWAVIGVTGYKYIRSIEETLIILALDETDSQKAVLEVFEPQARRHGQAIQALDQPEARSISLRGPKVMGQMNPDWIVQLGLDKGRCEINRTSGPTESESECEQDPYH
jgi:hypothetical protein